MKNKSSKKVMSITVNKEILKKIDEKTSNRSSLINSLLKEYFYNIGEDVKKIKL